MFDNVRDRVAGSDPGWNRLRLAVSGGVGVASSLALEYALARMTHADAQTRVILMMLGAMIAMTGSMALIGPRVWPKVRTAAFFPVAVGAGMAAGVAVGGHTDLMLGVFVLVMFVAVFVRRFGPDFFTYGFMSWMGYFFATFTHATPATLPRMLIAVAAASTWVLLLSITVLRARPRRALARTLRAFSARSRDVARASASVLEAAITDPEELPRWRRRLAGRQARLGEAALVIEAWSAEPGAVPGAASAAGLRRHLLDAQLAIDGLAAAAVALSTLQPVDGRDTSLVVEAARTAGLLASRDYPGADRVARTLLGAVDRDAAAPEGAALRRAVRHLAAAAAQFAAVANRVAGPSGDLSGAGGLTESSESDEFEPAITLAFGNLPGAPSLAGDVPPRGPRWNPLLRLDFVTRQAVQAAVAGGLAIVVGREISTARYYWAVIAAFVAFSGTATRSEVSVKAGNRVAGTLVGLFAGLGLARLTSGHTMVILAAVVISTFFGLYLMRVSYWYMIFFITIMISQLYSVLHELSDGLLLLRLEETAAGAAIGVVVGLVLAPVHTDDVVATVRSDLFTALAGVLRAAADRLRPAGREPVEPAPDLDALTRGVDLRLFQLLLAAAPLNGPLALVRGTRRLRHRITLYSACAHYARSLAVAVRDPSPKPSREDSAAARELASAAEELAGPADGARQSALAHLAAADTALFARLAPDTAHPAVRPMLHLQRLLQEYATGGAAVPDPVASAPEDATPAVPPAAGARPAVPAHPSAHPSAHHRPTGVRPLGMAGTGDAEPCLGPGAGSGRPERCPSPVTRPGSAGPRPAGSDADAAAARHRHRRGASRPGG